MGERGKNLINITKKRTENKLKSPIAYIKNGTMVYVGLKRAIKVPRHG